MADTSPNPCFALQYGGKAYAYTAVIISRQGFPEIEKKTLCKKGVRNQ